MPKKLFPINNRSAGRKYSIATPKSSVTRNVSYSETDKIIEVEYNHGAVYQYLDIPKKVWKQYEDIIRSGQSSGEFLNNEIKSYACIKLK